jgi:hypothetical protein
VTYRKFTQLEILQQLWIIVFTISDDVSDTIVELVLPSCAILQSSDDSLSATRMRIAVWEEVWDISTSEKINNRMLVTYRNVGPGRCVVVQGQV